MLEWGKSPTRGGQGVDICPKVRVYIAMQPIRLLKVLIAELAPQNLSSTIALVSDSVLLYAEAIRQMNGSRYLQPPSLPCDESVTWSHGYSVVNFMKTSTIRGLTGDIRFDVQGKRTDFVVGIIELASAGVLKVGTWNSSTGLNFSRIYVESSAEFDASSLKNMTFRVLTSLVKIIFFFLRSSAC